MDTPITRAEHEAFAQLMKSENDKLAQEDRRQNQRIGELEEEIRQTRTLTASVEKLAVSMESMVKEQEQQGKRLETLEARDGEMWRNVTGYIITAVIGIVIGFVFTQIGL